MSEIKTLNGLELCDNYARTQLDTKADSSHTHTVSQISDLTATATELNFVDGVTSNIQSQLDSKASSSHGHTLTIIDGGDGYLTFTVGDAEAEVNTALEEVVNASY